MPSNDDFTSVRSEGGLLPPDLLRRIVAGDQELGGLSPKDYALPATDRLGEAAARVWARAKAYWAAFRASVQDLPPSETGVTETREQWLRPLLRDLGYRELEFRSAAEVIGERRYLISHRSGPVAVHLVSTLQDLDRSAPSASGERRMSPHALVQEYLNVSDALYGIVSNGRLLRLLRDNASITRQAYVELTWNPCSRAGCTPTSCFSTWCCTAPACPSPTLRGASAGWSSGERKRKLKAHVP